MTLSPQNLDRAQTTPDPLHDALKEWAVAVDALSDGETIALLRKGGIRDRGGQFQVKSDRVWLYPTYEHQKPELLQIPYADRVSPVPSGWHPETVTLRSWAQVDRLLSVREPQAAFDLLPELVWNEAFVRDRLNWKPERPLFLLLLRTYRLAEPVELPYRPQYGGCRSWIELESALATGDRDPALSDADYAERRSRLEQILA